MSMFELRRFALFWAPGFTRSLWTGASEYVLGSTENAGTDT